MSVTAAGVNSFLISGVYAVKSLTMPLTIARTGCTSAQLTLTTTIMTIVQFFSAFFAGRMLKKLGPAKCIAMYCLTSLVYVYCYLQISGSLIPVYVAAAVVGLTLSCGSNSGTNALLAEWYEGDRARVTSVIFAASAAGSTLTSLAISALKGTGDADALYHTFYWVFAALIVMSVFFIKRPSDIKERSSGKGNGARSADDGTKHDPTASEVLHSPFFYLFCLAVLVYGSGMCMSYIVTIILTDIGYGESASAIYTGYCLCNCLMNLAAGRTYGIFRSRAIFIHLSFMAAAYACVALGVFRFSSIVLVLLGLIFYSAGSSGTGLIAVVAYPDVFGLGSYTQLMPVILGCSSIAGGCSPTIMSYISEKSGSWLLPFILSGSFMLLSMALWSVLLLSRRRVWRGRFAAKPEET